MTQFLGYLDIVAAGNTTFKTSSAGMQGLIIGNESGYSATIALDGTAFNKSLYPGTVDFFPVGTGFSGTVKIKTEGRLNNVALWPSSYLQFDAVGYAEKVNTGVYPLTLPRLTNIGNNVPVSTSTNAVTAEGAAINTEVIDIGPVGNLKVIDIFNDHFIWSVVQAGVAHQILKGNIAGNPLQIGQAGDVSEVLGKFTIDQLLTLTPTLLATLNGGVSGTLQVYQIWGGTIQLFFLSYTNFKEGGAQQQITFANAGTKGAIGICTDAPGIEFFNVVTRQNVDQFTTALNSQNVSSTDVWLFYQCVHPITSFKTTASNASAHTGFHAFLLY